MQCACNSLFALCWSQVQTVSRWNKTDLNHVLTEGDLLFKSLNIVDMLTADDLPRSIVMSNIKFPVDFLELKTELGLRILERSEDPFSEDLFQILVMSSCSYCLWVVLQLC